MSHDSVKAAFEKQVVLLPLDIILPQKEVTQVIEAESFINNSLLH
jgi:hypothetical protein